MTSRFVRRLSGALAIALGVGIGVFLVDGRPDGAAVALVGAVTAGPDDLFALDATQLG